MIPKPMAETGASGTGSGGSRQQRIPRRDVHGILLLDKPEGITSNRALQQVKRLYNARKAGHTGSLDPLASGMLPLCFGQATKVSHWLLDADKVYEVEMAIGAQTDTADADGAVIDTSDRCRVTPAELKAALAAHIGPIDQVPPMYSALKHQGRRLYELARAGQDVERKPRSVTIFALDVVRFDAERPVLRVHCSKGTYVRTLVETIAAQMGTLAHVVALRRLSLGPFAAADMVSMEQLEAVAGESRAALDALLLPADEALVAFPALELTEAEAFYLRNGHPVGHAPRDFAGLARIYGPGREFLGVGEVLDDGRIAPRRLFPAG
jgi:tRNA pseudouridine55 synthase